MKLYRSKNLNCFLFEKMGHELKAQGQAGLKTFGFSCRESRLDPEKNLAGKKTLD